MKTSSKEGVFLFSGMSNLNPLRKKDKVAIIATAKRIEFDLDPALETLKAWGLEPVLGKFTLEQNGYFAGSDEEKIRDFNWAVMDPEIKGIIFLRGGYGTTRIIDEIKKSLEGISTKWMVGYSDLTSLIFQLHKQNIPMVHGSMCSTLGKNHLSDEALKSLLFGQKRFDFPLIANTLTMGHEMQGSIIGGNLSLIYESIGARNEVIFDGKILFLEELGEEMYAIDRMMNKLKRIGALDKLKGLILGSFTGIGNRNDYFQESVEELICNYFEPELPKVVGLQAGHDEVNYPILMSALCKISYSKEHLNLKYLDQESSNQTG